MVSAFVTASPVITLLEVRSSVSLKLCALSTASLALLWPRLVELRVPTAGSGRDADVDGMSVDDRP